MGNERTVAWTDLGTVIVSTICLTDPVQRALDGMVELVGTLVNPDSDRPAAQTSALDYAYETMVFAAADGEVTNWTELACARYATRDAAEAGHATAVQEWTVKELDAIEVKQ
jgi:hypothetical protein